MSDTLLPIRLRLQRWSGATLALQAVLFALYLAFWLDVSPTDDITFDFVVFVASPFVFAVALIAGVLGTESHSPRRTVSETAVGNALMVLCFLGSVGVWFLFGFAALAFRLE